jgi:hypothetical protein
MYQNQHYYQSPRSMNSIAKLNVSGSSACRLPSISRRHSRRRPSTAWYCGDSEPKVFRAFARLADILTRGWLDWEYMEAWGVEHFEEGLVVVRSRACHFEAQTGREQAEAGVILPAVDRAVGYCRTSDIWCQIWAAYNCSNPPLASVFLWSTSKASTMADTDESAIHSSDATQIETDLSDETQDFRFLNNLSL